MNMASEKILHLDASNFDTTISNSGLPLVVDFWAAWCGPCKAIEPLLGELAEELKGKVQVCKVDVDKNAEIAARFNVRAIPTLLLFKNQQKVGEIVGLTSKADLKAKLEKLV